MRLFLLAFGCYVLLGACIPSGSATAQSVEVAHYTASFCASPGSHRARSQHVRATARARLIELRAVHTDAWQALPAELHARAEAIAERGECS